MLSFFTKLMPVKGWLIVAFGLLLASSFALGKLLLSANQVIGEKEALIQQWQQANNAWSQAWIDRDIELKSAQDRLSGLEASRQEINNKLVAQRKIIEALKNEDPSFNDDLGDAFWLHIDASATAANATRKVPDH